MHAHNVLEVTRRAPLSKIDSFQRARCQTIASVYSCHGIWQLSCLAQLYVPRTYTQTHTYTYIHTLCPGVTRANSRASDNLDASMSDKQGRRCISSPRLAIAVTQSCNACSFPVSPGISSLIPLHVRSILQNYSGSREFYTSA